MIVCARGASVCKELCGESVCKELWVPEVVVGISDPRFYQVVLKDGWLWCWHIDKLRHWVRELDATDVPPTSPTKPDQEPGDIGPWQPMPHKDQQSGNIWSQATDISDRTLSQIQPHLFQC